MLPTAGGTAVTDGHFSIQAEVFLTSVWRDWTDQRVFKLPPRESSIVGRIQGKFQSPCPPSAIEDLGTSLCVSPEPSSDGTWGWQQRLSVNPWPLRLIPSGDQRLPVSGRLPRDLPAARPVRFTVTSLMRS